MSQLKDAIRILHARKDKAYGAAWKRRGERISIVPNIARKVDRLTVFAADESTLHDESIFDTAVDLNVYCIKYLLFLAERNSDLLSKLPFSDPILPISDRDENFDRFVEATNYDDPGDKSLKALLNQISNLFEKLWPTVEADSALETRFEIARALCNASTRLVAYLRLEGGETVSRFIESELALNSKERHL